MRRKKYNPFLLHVMMLCWDGLSSSEIAARTNRSDNYISNLLNSEEAKEIYSRLESQTIETHQQTQAALQALQPHLMREKIKLALTASHEAVKNKALQELLEMGGHGAVKQLEIRRPDQVEEEYANKSLEEIRQELLSDLTPKTEDANTIH